MIGSSVLGVSIFRVSDLMYSMTLNVLIKILEGLMTSEPNRNFIINIICIVMNIIFILE